MSYLRKEKRNFLLILQYPYEHDDKIDELLKTIRYKLKNKTVSGNAVELTVEVHVKRNQTGFMNEFTSSEHVTGASLIEYNGDYT
jgi:hypothetical protein